MAKATKTQTEHDETEAAEVPDEIREIIDEAETDFDLGAELSQRPMRAEPAFRVFTDEPTAEALGWATPVLNNLGIAVDTRRAGVLGKIDKLRAENKDGVHDQAILALLDEAEALQRKLAATAVDFNLTALPTVIKKDARRTAKKALGIKGKGVPEEREDEFNEQVTAEMLHRSVLSYFPHAFGKEIRGMSLDRAKATLRGLPESEADRLRIKLADLQFARIIGESVTETPDF